MSTEKNIIKEANNDIVEFDPNRLTFYKNTNSQSFGPNQIDNTFSVFKSMNGDHLLLYGTQNKSIECYDLEKEKVVSIIPKAFSKNLSTIRYYCDKNKKTELILAASSNEKCIQLWNFNQWKLMVTIKDVCKGNLHSACLLDDKKKNQIFIISSSFNEKECLKVWDLNKKVVKEIKDSQDYGTFFVDTYYDDSNDINFIISGNRGYLKSFDYEKNKFYKIYSDIESNGWYRSAIVVKTNNIVKLFGICDNGFFLIWDFHLGEMLKKFNVNLRLSGLCLWNDSYVFVCGNKKIALIDIQKNIIAKTFEEQKNEVVSIKKLKFTNLGECLISQGMLNDNIKIWKI